jgi:hypothetical protein
LAQGPHALHAVLHQLAAGLEQPGRDLGQVIGSDDHLALAGVDQHDQRLLDRLDHRRDGRRVRFGGIATGTHKPVSYSVATDG